MGFLRNLFGGSRSDPEAQKMLFLGPMKEMADAGIVVPINSTPQVESFHLALEHLICGCLKQKIEES